MRWGTTLGIGLKGKLERMVTNTREKNAERESESCVERVSLGSSPWRLCREAAEGINARMYFPLFLWSPADVLRWPNPTESQRAEAPEVVATLPGSRGTEQGGKRWRQGLERQVDCTQHSHPEACRHNRSYK